MAGGLGLKIPELPDTYAEWKIDRQRHLEEDLVFSRYTAELYRQYWRHLGPWRYALLLQFQALLVPEHVRRLLKLEPKPWLHLAVFSYRALVRLGLRPLVQRVLLPGRYLPEVRKLDYLEFRVS